MRGIFSMRWVSWLRRCAVAFAVYCSPLSRALCNSGKFRGSIFWDFSGHSFCVVGKWTFSPPNSWLTQAVKQARFFVCLNKFWCWFVVNSACTKCGKGKFIEHFALAESLACWVCLIQKLDLLLNGGLCFGGSFITVLAWVDSWITQPLQLWLLVV